jgi:drug/metabolite transporter (DMT)-like permease
VLGAIVLGEPVTPATLAAGALIIVAVAMLLVSQGRARVARHAAAAPQAPVSEVA